MLALAKFDMAVDHSTIPTVGICELIALVVTENEQLAELLVPPFEDEAPPVEREPPVTAVLDDDVTLLVWDTPPEVAPLPVAFELPPLPSADDTDVESGETLHARAKRTTPGRINTKVLLP